jgi:hypothetical protein
MDHYSASALTMDSIAASSSSDVTSPSEDVSAIDGSSSGEMTPSSNSSSPQADSESASDSQSNHAQSAAHPTQVSESQTASALKRQQPIPPASEPMQYRAIGLVKGKYVPSEEQFTRGLLMTDDDTGIDAVLLGRVMSLVKKHLNLEEPHLWVVYPRTRNKTNDLHVQIVGVWEPETLNRINGSLDSMDYSDVEDDASLDADSADDLDDELDDVEIHEEAPEVADEAPAVESQENVETPVASAAAPVTSTSFDAIDPQDGYFSVRGEVLFYSAQDERVIIKIQQAARKNTERPKAFKLALKGSLEGKVVGYFWELHVQRQEQELLVQDGRMVALVPPKKKKKLPGGKRLPRGRFSGGPGGPIGPGGAGGAQRPLKKRWDGSKEGKSMPQTGGDRPSPATSAPVRRDVPKPIKRSKDESKPGSSSSSNAGGGAGNSTESSTSS